MSQPHFFEADAKYQTAIAGLDPTNEKYRTVVDIEPVLNPNFWDFKGYFYFGSS